MKSTNVNDNEATSVAQKKKIAVYLLAGNTLTLTADILENNEFEHKTDIVWHDIYVLRYRIELANKELERDHILMLSKDPYDVFYWVPEVSAVSALNFRYVHELQHLMRWFKIEKKIEL